MIHEIFCPNCMKNKKLYLGTRIPSAFLDFLCLNCRHRFSYKPAKFMDLKPKKKARRCVECQYSEGIVQGMTEILFCTFGISAGQGIKPRRIGKLNDNPKAPEWCGLEKSEMIINE